MEEKLFINKIIKTLKKYFLVILLLIVIGGVVGKLMTSEAPPPTYSAFAQILLERGNPETDNGIHFHSDENTRFYATVITMVETPIILDTVKNNLNLEQSNKELQEQITTENINNSKIIRVTVTDTDRENATKIANEIIETVELEVKNHIEISNAEIIEKAVKGEENETIFARPRSNMIMGVIVGGVLGIFLSFALDYLFKRRNKA
jgi:capsular polysaccharide biosynthesis protein